MRTFYHRAFQLRKLGVLAGTCIFAAVLVLMVTSTRAFRINQEAQTRLLEDQSQQLTTLSDRVAALQQANSGLAEDAQKAKAQANTSMDQLVKEGISPIVAAPDVLSVPTSTPATTEPKQPPVVLTTLPPPTSTTQPQPTSSTTEPPPTSTTEPPPTEPPPTSTTQPPPTSTTEPPPTSIPEDNDHHNPGASIMSNIQNTQKELDKRFLFDVAERVAWTFVQVFLALWLAPVAADILNGSAQTLNSIWGSIADTSVLDKAAVGALGAVISFLKSFGLSKYIGSPNTAATLPTVDDTPHV